MVPVFSERAVSVSLSVDVMTHIDPYMFNSNQASATYPFNNADSDADVLVWPWFTAEGPFSDG